MDDNRILITSIQIKNFRSIRNITIDAKNFNIFVGLNDAGKSNLLKALNLFFNNQTDYNTEFNFKSDFSFLFPKKSHNTREIKIIIKFLIPKGYKDNGIYIWEKTWRTDNYFKEKLTNESGNVPSPRSRIPGALKRIKYRYVPAVKSKEYYKSLLSDLYIAVSASLTNPLTKSTENFSTALKEYTKHISDDVASRLHITSELTVPDNLSDIFKALIFKTTSDNDTVTVPLDYRGDGIQARHIPIILKYIAEENQQILTQGATRIYTIWGFEEPENGVELAKAFEMAEEFNDYSHSIQLFVSTHSPAFYMKQIDENTIVYFATKKPNNDGTLFSESKSTELIGNDMGLMPIVAPFIASKMDEIQQLKKLANEHILTDVNTILVEGITDKTYLELAIKRYSPKLSKLLDEGALRIFSKKGQGGTTQISDWAKSWVYSGNSSKIYILFDKDSAGIQAKTSLDQELKIINRGTPMKVQFLEPSQEIINLFKNKIDLYYEIEHLLSDDFWTKIKAHNYAIPRDDTDLIYSFSRHFSKTESLDTTIQKLVKKHNLVSPIITMNPNDDKKDQIKNLAVSEFEKNPNTDILSGLQNTIEKLNKFF